MISFLRLYVQRKLTEKHLCPTEMLGTIWGRKLVTPSLNHNGLVFAHPALNAAAIDSIIVCATIAVLSYLNDGNIFQSLNNSSSREVEASCPFW